MRSHGSSHAIRSVHNGHYNVYTEYIKEQNNSLRLGCKNIFCVEKCGCNQRRYFLKTCVSKINPDKLRMHRRGNCTHCQVVTINQADFQPYFKTSPNEGFSPVQQNEKLLTVNDSAQILAVSTRTVTRLIAKGDIESIQIGRSRRIRPSAIDRFITKQQRAYRERIVGF